MTWCALARGWRNAAAAAWLAARAASAAAGGVASRRSVRGPRVLPQRARARATRGEGVGCVDGGARTRVGTDVPFEDRQHAARAVGRVARDLPEFVLAQLDLVRSGGHGAILPRWSVGAGTARWGRRAG